ncbi:MAG TPA: hypothetical protein VKI19_09975 [Acidimicrobiales bacterium]|nr:hypothetical protein [Acidimicrobiales bacterium]
MTFTSIFMSRRAWRRLERRGLRAHQRDVHEHLHELAGMQPAVVHGDASWTSGVVSLQMSGHQLVLAGVRPGTAWDVVAMTMSSTPPALTGAGRYGPFWWVVLRGEEEHVVLATHLQLRHDPGRAQEAEVHHPVLSGAT